VHCAASKEGVIYNTYGAVFMNRVSQAAGPQYRYSIGPMGAQDFV